MFYVEINEFKEKNEKLFDNIKNRILTLKKCQKNIDFNKPMSIISLDSSNVQREMFELQYKNFMKYKLMLINRIYCENYKIHKILAKEQNTNTIFPPYKDLDQDKEYDINHIIAMNKNIHDFIQVYKLNLKTKQSLLKEDSSIENQTSILEYDINEITNKITFYENYMTILEKSYRKNFNYLISSITLLSTDINDF